MSHDVSRDLKDVAVRVLCKAVEEFTSSYDEVYNNTFDEESFR